MSNRRVILAVVILALATYVVGAFVIDPTTGTAYDKDTGAKLVTLGQAGEVYNRNPQTGTAYDASTGAQLIVMPDGTITAAKLSPSAKSSDFVNVTDPAYGMVAGENVSTAVLAANTVALQAAVDTGKNVYIPAGTYEVNDKILIGRNAQVATSVAKVYYDSQTFYGDGPGVSVIHQITQSRLFSAETQVLNHVVFRNVTLMGPGVVNGSSNNADAHNASRAIWAYFAVNPSTHEPLSTLCNNNWEFDHVNFLFWDIALEGQWGNSVWSHCIFNQNACSVWVRNHPGNNGNIFEACDLIFQYSGSNTNWRLANYSQLPAIGIQIDSGRGYKFLGLDASSTGCRNWIKIGNATAPDGSTTTPEGWSTIVADGDGNKLYGASTNLCTVSVIGWNVECEPSTNATPFHAIDCGQDSYVYLTVQNGTFSASGNMAATDYPILQGPYACVTLVNCGMQTLAGTGWYGSASSPPTCAMVKRLTGKYASDPTTLTALGGWGNWDNTPPMVDWFDVTGVTKIGSHRIDAINAAVPQPGGLNWANAVTPSQFTVGLLQHRLFQGTADDQLLLGVQKTGTNQFGFDDLNQYNADKRTYGTSTVTMIEWNNARLTAGSVSPLGTYVRNGSYNGHAVYTYTTGTTTFTLWWAGDSPTPAWILSTKGVGDQTTGWWYGGPVGGGGGAHTMINSYFYPGGAGCTGSCLLNNIPTHCVSGARGGNAAITSLLSQLDAQGIIANITDP